MNGALISVEREMGSILSPLEFCGHGAPTGLKEHFRDFSLQLVPCFNASRAKALEKWPF